MGREMNSRILIAALAVTALTGCKSSLGNGGSAAQSTDQINQLLSKWQNAFEAKDVNGVMAMYAPGNMLTAYDIVPPLQYKGANAYRKDYEDFFAQFDGPLRVELRDNHVEGDGDFALAFGLERISGKLKSGTPVDMWVRYTSGFRKIDGRWRDIHDHISVPVDLNSGKAMLDLKP